MTNNLIKCLLLFFLLLLVLTNAQSAVISITQDSNVVNKINGAVDNDTILFYPGTYAVNIVLDNRNLRLEGVDTKNTRLKSANGFDPVIEIDGATFSVIQNFSFLDSETGVLINTGTAGVTIKNNVFNLGLANTAVLIGDSVTAQIENNTFYGNSVAINSTSNAITLKNNIFESYDDFVVGTVPDVVSYNCFETNLFGLDSTNKLIAEATFVDEKEGDFHLQKDSECLEIGEPEVDGTVVDIGAYGGLSLDNAPNAITITEVIEDGATVSVSWSESLDEQVLGYKLYYRTQPIYNSAQDVFLTLASRSSDLLNVQDTLTETSVILVDLPSTVIKPNAPKLSIIPGENKLNLSWGKVENATAYVVHYLVADDPEVIKHVGNVNSYVLTNLSNDLIYTVWLEAKNQLRYYFQVAAYVGDPDDNEFAESYFIHDDKEHDLGEAALSDVLSKITAQPESIVAYPQLPNEGCFIATAAFGFYSAQQVQVLRDFRDDYLLPTELGRDFVKWYYEYGPYAANYINEHEVLKPLVRAALYPLIIFAQLLETETVYYLFSALFFVMLLLMIKAFIFYFNRRVTIS